MLLKRMRVENINVRGLDLFATHLLSGAVWLSRAFVFIKEKIQSEKEQSNEANVNFQS